MNGIIVLNKEKNYTSRDIVNKASYYLKTKKIGHTGTLDPMATGVLVLCLGKATKLVELITAYDKEYIAEVTLGIKTDTLDITGEILEEQEVQIKKEKIEEVLKKMIGTYEQTVPIYSAIKIKGKKLYEYARNNIEVELPKRKVEIKKIDLIGDVIYKDNKTIFKIKCEVSKGTYIRSLINDIASSLNTIGTMSSLERTKQGNFKLEAANNLDDLKNDNYNLISIEKILDKYYIKEVDEKLYFKIKNGALIKNIYNKDIIVFTKNNKVISIYKIYEKNKALIKPWKMF